MAKKILGGLQDRRQLDQAIEGFQEKVTDQAMEHHAREIVQHYGATQTQAALIRHLETPHSQIRGGLGRLATLIPQEQIVPALRGTVANRSYSPQVRLTAALILQRYLLVDLEPALLGDISDPEYVAMQSLQEAVTEGQTNRYILLEYMRQLRQESAEIGHMILRLIRQLDPGDQPALLRLAAMDTREPIALAALEALANLQNSTAAHTLSTLIPSLAPALAARAEDSLRRLRFRGVALPTPSIQGWRALLSPVDPGGRQAIWFSHPRLRTEDEASGVLIGIYVDLLTGLDQAFGYESAEEAMLPPMRSIGELAPVDVGLQHPMIFLEAPFAYGRWHLQTILKRHWLSEKHAPLPDEYQLYSDHLWQFPPPIPDSTLTVYATQDASGQVSSPQQIQNAAQRLLRHPAMAGWLFQGPIFIEAARRLDPTQLTVSLPKVTREIAVQVTEANGDNMGLRLEAALRAQAGWLHISGSRQSAAAAHLLADQMAHLTLTDNPLVLLMVEASLRYALGQTTD